MEAFIVNYGKNSQIVKRKNIIRQLMRKRKLNHLKITFIDGGRKTNIRTRLWIFPKGVDPDAIY